MKGCERRHKGMKNDDKWMGKMVSAPSSTSSLGEIKKMEELNERVMRPV